MHPTIAKIQSKNLKKVPEIKTGYTVRVSQKVVEGSKERIQKFEGLVIKVGHGAGVEKTFTVRKIVEGIGVEKIFPMHSPNIVEIKVLKKAKVRRQKLYYMRGLSGKSARLTEKHVTDEERAVEETKMNALYEEAMKAHQEEMKEGASAEEQVADQEVIESPEPEEVKEEVQVEAEAPAEDSKEVKVEAEKKEEEVKEEK